MKNLVSSHGDRVCRQHQLSPGSQAKLQRKLKSYQSPPGTQSLRWPSYHPCETMPPLWASLVPQMVKNLPSEESACSAGDPCSNPRSGKSPGKGNGNPLQYSCLGTPMDRGAWWATVPGVTKSQTRLKRLGTHMDFRILRRKSTEVN